MLLDHKVFGIKIAIKIPSKAKNNSTIEYFLFFYAISHISPYCLVMKSVFFSAFDLSPEQGKTL